MRTLFEDGRVDSEVVTTLWQVYSKSVFSVLRFEYDADFRLGADREIPRFQRRGAIIILGMFALSRREVVTDRVDTLLRVGLGPLGKVCQTSPVRFV